MRALPTLLFAVVVGLSQSGCLGFFVFFGLAGALEDDDTPTYHIDVVSPQPGTVVDGPFDVQVTSSDTSQPLPIDVYGTDGQWAPGYLDEAIEYIPAGHSARIDLEVRVNQQVLTTWVEYRAPWLPGVTVCDTPGDDDGCRDPAAPLADLAHLDLVPAVDGHRLRSVRATIDGDEVYLGSGGRVVLDVRYLADGPHQLAVELTREDDTVVVDERGLTVANCGYTGLPSYEEGLQAVGPDGSFYYADDPGSSEGFARRIFDGVAEEIRLPEFYAGITDWAFGRDGTIYIAADRAVFRLDPTAPELEAELIDHLGVPTSVAVSPDGTLYVAAGIAIFRLEGSTLVQLGDGFGSHRVDHLAFTGPGKLVAATREANNGWGRFYRIAIEGGVEVGREVLIEQTGAARDLAAAPGGELFWVSEREQEGLMRLRPGGSPESLLPQGDLYTVAIERDRPHCSGVFTSTDNEGTPYVPAAFTPPQPAHGIGADFDQPQSQR